MDVIELQAIGHVRGGRDVPEDDAWEGVHAQIELNSDQFEADALVGLDHFSHVEIVFLFDRVDQKDRAFGAAILVVEPIGRKSGSSRSADAIDRTGSASPFAASLGYPALLSVSRGSTRSPAAPSST